ncbi:hypothetical protein [Blastopirellula marina]|uniref:Uncharacterized protein n=1 Tax=Blastopirellula marina TaxID=124 RepID=A0A2S8GCK2_9BACT|nr:hypothetical protein [Blastopirellula marina]PQO42030.1 hypothetical protein C5Y93_27115 [Blastopirellula marina]
MQPEPDLNFDIDALFAHMFDSDMRDEEEKNEVHDWIFTLRCQDLSKLEELADELEGEFGLLLQEEVETHEVDGSVTMGDPLLSVIQRGKLTADEVKQIAQRMQKIADERGLVYEGVDCYEAIDEEEIYGWLSPEDALWRLKHMADIGHPEDEALPYVFLVLTPDLDTTTKVSAALMISGYNDLELFNEPDENNEYAVCVFTSGLMDELGGFIESIGSVAESADARLEAIQFYDRETLHEVFGIDDEEE